MSLLRRLTPGLLLTGGVAGVAFLAALFEAKLFGNAVVDGLVLAILLGIAVRTVLRAPGMFEDGIDVCAKQVLEVAVFLLGASVDLSALLRAGPALIVGIVLLVAIALPLSYGISRALGLPHPLALLIACGNAICGNSAIAAVAPVIHAERAHIASAIAFTAVLGVGAVLGLPLLIGPLGLSEHQYGVLVGLTVYAVPQVLAAAFPVGILAGQMATLVKLARVLLLGPVVLLAAVTHRRGSDDDAQKLRLAQIVPWFIVGFVVLAALRTVGVLPESLVSGARTLSHLLTLLAMAALGLSVEISAMRAVGGRVAIASALSLLGLIGVSLALIRVLGIV